MKTLRKDSNELSLLIFNKSLPYRWEQKRKKENKHNLPLLKADKSTLKNINFQTYEPFYNPRTYRKE